MQINLTKGSIIKTIAAFSLPYLLAYFLQTLYGLADVYITGQFNGSDAITAVSMGSQVMHMITVIIVGLAMGTTVVISQAVGAGRNKEISGVVGNTASMFLVMSVVLTIILCILIKPVLKVMRTPKEAMREASLYLRICFAGIPFITAYNVLSAVFRGMGDSKSPLVFVGIACVFNILLDYILIGVFKMGAAGAACATVFSQTASVVFAFVAIIKKRSVTMQKGDLRPDARVLSKIMKIGIPVALQDGLIQVSFLVITIIANKRGVEIAAAVGIVEKIIGMLFLIPSSMLSSISAISAQNNGAGLHKRAVKTLRYGILICIGFGAVFTLICRLRATDIIGMFSDEEVVIEMGAQYLKSYVIDCIVAGVHFCFSGFFCAYSRSIASFVHNILSIVLVRIPGAYLASVYFPDDLTPMGLAAPAGSLLSVFICIGIYIALRKKIFNSNSGIMPGIK